MRPIYKVVLRTHERGNYCIVFSSPSLYIHTYMHALKIYAILFFEVYCFGRIPRYNLNPRNVADTIHAPSP